MFDSRRDPKSLVAHARRRAQHQWEGMLRQLRPVEVGGQIVNATFEVTFVCNLRCPMCSQWGDDGLALKMLRGEVDDARIKKEMTFEQWKGIADQLVKHRSTVSLTGGEVFMRPYLTDLAQYISDRGLRVNITTNGTKCSDEDLRRLATIENLIGINFSIDGDEEDHDRIRGKGNFRRTLDAAAKLVSQRNALRPKRYPTLEVRSNSCLHPSSFRGLPALAEKLKAAEIDQMNISPLRWFTREMAETHARMLREDFGIEDAGSFSEVGQPFPPEFPEEATRVLSSLTDRYGSFVYVNESLSARNIRAYHTDVGWSLGYPCNHPWRSIRIRADGKVIICPDQWISTYFWGDLKTQSVDEVWQGSQGAAFRVALRDHGWPGCAKCCITNRNDSS